MQIFSGEFLFLYIFHQLKCFKWFDFLFSEIIFKNRKESVTFIVSRYFTEPYFIYEVIVQKCLIYLLSTDQEYLFYSFSFQNFEHMRNSMKCFDSFFLNKLRRQDNIATIRKWSSDRFIGFSSHNNLPPVVSRLKFWRSSLDIPRKLSAFTDDSIICHRSDENDFQWHIIYRKLFFISSSLSF